MSNLEGFLRDAESVGATAPAGGSNYIEAFALFGVLFFIPWIVACVAFVAFVTSVTPVTSVSTISLPTTTLSETAPWLWWWQGLKTVEVHLRCIGNVTRNGTIQQTAKLLTFGFR